MFMRPANSDTVNCITNLKKNLPQKHNGNWKDTFAFLREWGSVSPPPLAEISAKNTFFSRAPLDRLLLLEALSRVHKLCYEL